MIKAKEAWLKYIKETPSTSLCEAHAFAAGYEAGQKEHIADAGKIIPTLRDQLAMTIWTHQATDGKSWEDAYWGADNNMDAMLKAREK